MGRPAGRSIDLEFTNNSDTIYTARAGLVPLNEVAKKMKLPQAIDQACAGVRHDSYTDYKSSQLVMFRLLGHLAGFHRAHQLLTSCELPFISKLVNFDEKPPSGSTFGRFYEGFQEHHIANLQGVNFDLATKNVIEVSGFHIIVHDQSAIQKYGKNMEGVEKGYGGTMKRGAKMLQCSLVVDAGMYSILRLEIREGSTHSNFGAAAELDDVLAKLPEAKPGKRLVLGDSAYGIGAYMRKCDHYNANFILAVKNDKWMKGELAALDFQRFVRGKEKENAEYGYREFTADRDAWKGVEPNELFGDDWDGARRVIVVRLPVKPGDDAKFQFLITSLSAEKYTAEEVHALYRKNRESIELINDEMKNQIGLTELSSHELDANRAIGQVIALAWNLQRHIEHVGMVEDRKEENIRRSLRNIAESRKTQRRYEWWTMFIRFITVGGRLKTRSNKLAVVVGQNEALQRWLDSLEAFNWREYSLVA